MFASRGSLKRTLESLDTLWLSCSRLRNQVREQEQRIVRLEKEIAGVRSTLEDTSDLVTELYEYLGLAIETCDSDFKVVKIRGKK